MLELGQLGDVSALWPERAARWLGHYSPERIITAGRSKAMRVPVDPAMLHWASERSGRRGTDELYARFPKLAEWEREERQPTLRQLEDFARATYTPVGYFFLPEPPEERVPIPDFRTLPRNRLGRPSPHLLETIYVCQQRQEWYREYARAAGEEPRRFVGAAQVGEDVVAVAAQIRDTLRFDLEERRRLRTWTEALRKFIAQAEEAGVLVMVSGVVLNNTHRKLDPGEFRGFALAEDLAPLVFVNWADTKSAQMFTLAHELAHIWIGQTALTLLANTLSLTPGTLSLDVSDHRSTLFVHPMYHGDALARIRVDIEKLEARVKALTEPEPADGS